jgi:hypothetical protein
MSTKPLPLFRLGVPLAVSALTLAAAAPVQAAEFSEAEIFVELNDSDGDLGLHGSIDGGPYRRLEIEDPRGRTLLLLSAHGRLARQGMTQLAFESAEPPFDELAPGEFFARFPEGEYEIEGTTFAGQEFEATWALSHVLAAPAGNITVGGLPAAANCDELPLPTVSGMVVIDWDPVTESHPEIGATGKVEIARYQLFVEQGDAKFGVDLPPDITEYMVPPDMLALGGRFKFEIIARTDTGNNTAVETCFVHE